jgi:hypothetical protein
MTVREANGDGRQCRGNQLQASGLFPQGGVDPLSGLRCRSRIHGTARRSGTIHLSVRSKERVSLLAITDSDFVFSVPVNQIS